MSPAPSGRLLRHRCLRRERAGVKISPSRLASSRHLLSVAAAAHRQRERFKAAERRDFRFQLADGARRGRLVENLLLGGLDFVIGRFLKVLDVVAIERGPR